MFSAHPFEAFMFRYYGNFDWTANGFRPRSETGVHDRQVNKILRQVDCILNRHGGDRQADFELRPNRCYGSRHVLRVQPDRHECVGQVRSEPEDQSPQSLRLPPESDNARIGGRNEALWRGHAPVSSTTICHSSAPAAPDE